MSTASTTSNVALSAFQKQVLKARDVSVPLCAIRTADAASTVQVVSRIVVTANDAPAAVVQWDAVRGFQPVNTPGQQIVKALGGDQVTNPVEALQKADKLPDHGAVMMLNAHDYYGHADFRQALWNLRDPFKRNWRTAYLLQPSGGVPQALEHDVLVLDEPLPGPDELAQIVLAQYDAAKVKRPTEDAVVRRAVDAVAGLSAFAAEQAVALSLMRSGIDFVALRERHRQMIENAKGLSVWKGKEAFDALGGLAGFKAFGRRFLEGRYSPGAVLWVDEVEKALAGVRGDLTGISQDYLATMLGFMQDHEIPGILLMGHPGTGKSALSKALAGEAGVPCVRMDMGAMHGSLVGESQHAIRHALKVATAISRDRLVVVATCNSVAVLPPEFVNRFKWRFFVDLPDDQEKAAIWPIHRKRFEIDPKEKQPDDTGWNGREIEQCCNTAYMLKCSLLEASEMVVPISQSSAEEMARRRNEAHGRYLSASHSGVFSQTAKTEEVSVAGRKVRVRDREEAWVAPADPTTKH